MTPGYMLDTNICIYLLKRQPPEVFQRFAACYAGEVVMSAITYAELCFGTTVAQNPHREVTCLRALISDIPVSPFDHTAAEAFAPIRYATQTHKRDLLDKLIAAHAKALDVILVTNNERDFLRYPGLRIENWVTGYATQTSP